MPPEPELIRIRATLRETLSMTWALRRELASISALWVPVVFVASGVAAWLRGQPFSTSNNLAVVALGTVVTLASVSMGIGWHRMLLLREKPASPYLRCDALVLLYAGVLFAAQVTGWLLLRAIALLQTTVGDMGGVVVSIVAGTLAILVLVRLSLLLPAIAIGRTDGALATLRTIWTGTRGNTWRLFIGYAAIPVLCLLVLGPIWFAGHRLIGGQLGQLASALSEAATDTLNVLVGMPLVTFASLCYWQLFSRED